MQRAGNRLEILRIKCEGVKVAIPAHCIEWMMSQRYASEARPVFDKNINVFLLIDGDYLARPVQITLRVWRTHFD